MKSSSQYHSSRLCWSRSITSNHELPPVCAAACISSIILCRAKTGLLAALGSGIRCLIRRNDGFTISTASTIPLTRQERGASLGSGVKGREMDCISLSIGGRRADRSAEMQRLSYIRHFAAPFKNGRRGVSTSFRPLTAVCAPFVTASVPFCSLPFLIRSDKNCLSCPVLYWPFLVSTKSV